MDRIGRASGAVSQAARSTFEWSILALVKVNAGSYSVRNGVRSLPEIDAVPDLDVVAAVSRDTKTLTLFCVNRSLVTDIPARIELHDFAAQPTAQVYLVNSRFLTE